MCPPNATWRRTCVSAQRDVAADLSARCDVGADLCLCPTRRGGGPVSLPDATWRWTCVSAQCDVGADLCVRPTGGVPHAASTPMGVSLRSPHFDYTSAGGYFVTITVHERKALLGSLDDSRAGVTPSHAGKMVERWWLELPQKFQPVTLNAHAVMPDHFHGIVLLQCSDNASPDPARSSSTIIQWFKTMTTANTSAECEADRGRGSTEGFGNRGSMTTSSDRSRTLPPSGTTLRAIPGSIQVYPGADTHI